MTPDELRFCKEFIDLFRDYKTAGNGLLQRQLEAPMQTVETHIQIEKCFKRIEGIEATTSLSSAFQAPLASAHIAWDEINQPNADGMPFLRDDLLQFAKLPMENEPECPRLHVTVDERRQWMAEFDGWFMPVVFRCIDDAIIQLQKAIDGMPDGVGNVGGSPPNDSQRHSFTFDKDYGSFAWGTVPGKFASEKVGRFVSYLTNNPHRTISIPTAIENDSLIAGLRPRDLKSLPSPFDKAISPDDRKGYIYDPDRLR